MDFDLVLVEIGEFGRYQQINYLLLCLPVLFAAANSLSYVFTAGIPNYRCFVAACDHPDDPIYNKDWIHYAVPGTISSNSFTPAQCLMYKNENETNIVSLQQNECRAEWFTNEEIGCNRWVFDDYENTIVQEWNITCPDNQWMLSLVGSMHFAGIIVGSAISGILADRFGRKIIFVLCIIFMSVTGVGQALSSSYIMFLIFGFLNAVGTSGVYPLAFIIAVEMVGPKRRELSGVITNYFYAIGEAFVGLIAWLCTDWTTIQYIVSAPSIIFVAYYWIIPESVRWHLAKNQTDKAGKIIKKAANVNGVTLSDNIIQIFELKANENDKDTPMLTKPIIVLPANKQEEQDMLKTIKQLLRSKTLIVRLLILFYIWATNAFVYYGLSLNSTNLSGNKYLNFTLVCLIEIPGYTLAWIGMNKIGRRWSLAASLLLCGFTCVAGAYVPEDYTWAMITLFLIGKLGITSSFGIVYVHSAEMLPTIIRSGGVGSMSTVARLGALVAPFVPLLNFIYKPLPLLLFGSVSLFGGILALILPETLGEKLPETVEEAKNIGKACKHIE